MKLHKTLLAFAAAAAITPAAFANNFVGGELGYESHPARTTLTRAEVREEFQRFRTHPVLSDGTVVLQGEAGYVSAVQGQSADRHHRGVDTHAMGGSASSAAPVAPRATSEGERRAYRDQYIN